MKRFLFLISVLLVSALDRLRGRSLAINTVVMPFQSNNGTGTYAPDAAIAFDNAVVKIGSTDRNIAAVSNVADVPLGVLLHDQVSSGDVGNVTKVVAFFGLFKETLPAVSTTTIAAGGYVVPDPANPGKVKALPGATGTYFVVGRARFAVTAVGDPVSIIHCLPFAQAVA